MPRTKPTKPLPDDSDRLVKVSVDLRASGVRWLDDRAAATGGTRSDLIRAALRAYREREDRAARPAPKPPRGPGAASRKAP